MSGEHFSRIVPGPEDDYPIPEEPFAEMIWNSLKSRDSEQAIIVNALTEETLTYGKLLNKTLKLIQVLKTFNLKEGDVIAIISENNFDFLLPLIASILMGITVNPMNPDYSIGELSHALNISKPKVLFCSNKALNNVLQSQKKFAFIESIILIGHNHTESKVKLLKNLLIEEPRDLNNFEPSPSGTLVFLSSGTTGLSKGAIISHSNFKESLITFLNPKYWDMNSEDTTILALPCFHMYGTLIILGSILSSMKTILMDKFKPEVFLESIEKYKVNKLYLVPSLLLFLIKSPLVNKYDISSINDIVISAAPVGKDLQTEAIKCLGPKVRVCYAMTEMSGTCTIQMKGEVIPGSVGRLAPGLSAKIWDPDNNRNLGPLETGELCFKGPTVMQGYLANPDATKGSFDEDGFYHSGDAGFYDKNGIFYIVARIKEIIKCKGFQVPPVELETLILTHSAVKDCGVIGIPDKKAGQVPLAYVVRRENCILVGEDITKFVSDRISLQKRLYGGVKFIDQIPRNPSGKILRRKLREIYEKDSINEV